MGSFEKPVANLGRFGHFGGTAPYKDWIDVEFVLQEIEEEKKAEVLAAYLKMVAKVYQSMAEGVGNMGAALSGGGAQERGQ
jgi:hypothetical protein